VEFALVASVLVVLLLGTTQFGLMRYEWSQVNRLVETGALYVTKNSNSIYDLNNPFSPSSIASAVGTNALGDSLTVTGGCACPIATGLNTSDLTAFGTTGSRCTSNLTCNGNTTAPAAYVILSASHTHSGPLQRWTSTPVTAKAVVRIQ
jgi:Flp pilus assembly protein TadG